MAKDDFHALVRKTTRLGRNPMPIKLRPDGERYTIINGEHNFKAALEAGLSEVWCEIEDVDQFEAMRQTLDYNRHGQHDSLLEGLMFQQMMQARNLARRELAKELQCSDGKIRTGLKYVEAIALRIGCEMEKVRFAYAAHPDEVDRISSLSNAQVRMYTKMEACLRDRWLDAGAKMDPLMTQYFFPQYKSICSGEDLVERLTDSGLVRHVEPDLFFAKSLKYVAEFAFWCGDHIDVENIHDYAHPVIENKLPVELLERLPLEPVGNGELKVILSIQEWSDIIAH